MKQVVFIAAVEPSEDRQFLFRDQFQVMKQRPACEEALYGKIRHRIEAGNAFFVITAVDQRESVVE